MVDCGRAFQSLTVCIPKDFLSWSVDARVIWSLLWFVSLPRAGLESYTRSIEDIGTATLWWRIMSRKARRWIRLWSSRGCHFNWSIRDVTLVRCEYCEVAHERPSAVSSPACCCARWCEGPILCSGIPSRSVPVCNRQGSHKSSMTSYSLCSWFDVLQHNHQIPGNHSPTRTLPRRHVHFWNTAINLRSYMGIQIYCEMYRLCVFWFSNICIRVQ